MFLKNFIKPINDTVTKTSSLQDVVDMMTKNSLHHIIIIENKKPIGLITEKDIISIFKDNVDFTLPAINFATKDIITLHGTRLVQYALNIMVDNNIRKIIVINTKNEYLGCIEQEDIIYRFEEKLHESNISINELITMSNKAIIIDENESLRNALKIMSKNSLSALLISSNDKEPIGIISESDILKLAQKNVNQDSFVKDFMHFPLIKIDIQSSVDKMLLLMKEKNIRRVVVYDEYDMFYLINSQDLANNLKGNYTRFLESKLHDTRETFNAMMENVIEIIDIEDEQIIYWTNSITKKSFNVNIDDNITKIVPEKLWKRILTKLIKEKFISETIEINNSFYQLKASYSKISEDNIIKLFLNDITEITLLTKALEKENEIKEKLLFEQAKMVQLGEMIGNIAHQWRQPLTSISASSTGLILKKEMNFLSDNDFYELTNHITHNAEFLSETVDIFRNFIKEKKEIKKVVLQDRIDIALKIINVTFKSKNIQIINNINYKKAIEIKMYLGELEQVLINILNNAKDVLIERKVENAKVEISLESTKTHINILIEDNAGGINRDILPNIFDKYFTTKSKDEGTGLGLYMSKKIITDSLKGVLSVENKNKGACFNIQLPY